MPAKLTIDHRDDGVEVIEKANALLRPHGWHFAYDEDASGDGVVVFVLLPFTGGPDAAAVRAAD